jgi:diguanylate cyclase (GGDEF)-like protein
MVQAAEPACGSSLRGLERPALLFVGVTVAAGALASIAALMHVDSATPERLAILAALGLATATIRLSLPLAHGRSSMSLSYPVVLFATVSEGIAAGLLVAAGTAAVQSTIRTRSRPPAYRVAFNVASLAVTAALSGGAFFALRQETGEWLWSLAAPLALAGLVYFVVNTTFVASAVALTTGQSLRSVWLEGFLWSAPGYFVGAIAAGLAVVVQSHSLSWWLAVVAVPVYLTYKSYSTYVSRLEAGQQQTRRALTVQFGIVQALAVAIESKDRTSHLQLRRLAVYAEGLGRAVGLSETELHAVRTAALLHDIGNLAVPEHVLAKPGCLTFEEFQKVKIHPRVGAEILRTVPFEVPVAPLILAHHEHWDGGGYPEGLKGAGIPLAARVLAVADCYTALLSDRPHRPRYQPWEAMVVLERSRGTTLDPDLVDRFIERLPTLEAQVAALSSDHEDPRVAAAAGSIGDRALEDIVVARQEARALFEIAQALTASLGIAEAVETIVTNLGDLMPVRGGALFLWHEREARFSCRYATEAAPEGLAGAEAATLDEVCALAERACAADGSLALAGLVSPLMVGEHLLGGLVVVTVRDSLADHKRVLEHVSRQAALVIQNAVAFEETRQLSLTDPVTDLPNRRCLIQHLGHELARAERRDCRVALLLMDVDDFKRVNDTLGHDAGDRALREIGSVTRALLRPYDICARHGGDEFVVVLWDCDGAQAEGRAREVGDAVAHAAVPIGNGESFTCSVSIGTAVFPDDGRRPEQLLAAADARMYAHKSSRRGSRAPLAPGVLA